MNYEYKSSDNVNGKWKDSYGNVWEYGKQSGQVFGEIRKKVTHDTHDYLWNGNCRIEVMPVSQKTGFFNRIIGYIPCCLGDEKGCIRIVGQSYYRIVGILMIAIMLVTGGFLWMKDYQSVKIQDEVIHLDLPDSMHNDDPSGFSIPDYTSITKNVDNAKTDTWLVNVNDNPCDIGYEIYLDQDEKPIYTSPILKEGDVIQGMTLDKKLPVGHYNYTMVCTLYESKTQNIIGEQTLEGVLEVYAKT